MKPSLRIAHCSDIHLDGDSYRDDVDGRDWFRAAFDRALAAMRIHAPDLMLLAGDLFDSNTPSPETVAWAMDILDAQPFPIVMIPGNHDCMAENAVYRRHDFNDIRNVRMLSAAEGETAYLESLGVAVWGKGMLDHAPDYFPLAGCPVRPDGVRWYLGMGHGIHVPHHGSTGRSSPIHMREIEDSPCDYLALGHHHAAMELVTATTVAAYCGSPTDTVGRGATYAIVDMADDAPPALRIHELDFPE
jgi:DNA repair exonuclease SbcCD nuclease subunit